MTGPTEPNRAGRAEGAAPEGPHVPPYATVFARSHAFGVLAAVALPSTKDRVPEAVLARLDAREVEAARSLTGFDQVRWVGGRLAAHAAARHFGVRRWALLVGRQHEPVAPEGFAASISHKRTFAVALVSDTDARSVGVDLEDDVVAASRIAEAVLRPEERAALEELEEEDCARARLETFALKEAAFKALAVPLGRVLTFEDARVDFSSGRAELAMTVAGLACQPRVECRVERELGGVIAAVRAEIR